MFAGFLQPAGLVDGPLQLTLTTARIARLLARIADPDHPRLTELAGVGDVDVVGARGQVLTGAEAEGDVGVAGGVRGQRASAGRDVLVAGGVDGQRVTVGRDVVVAG
jgi:hypothetical protein